MRHITSAQHAAALGPGLHVWRDVLPAPSDGLLQCWRAGGLHFALNGEEITAERARLEAEKRGIQL